MSSRVIGASLVVYLVGGLVACARILGIEDGVFDGSDAQELFDGSALDAVTLDGGDDANELADVSGEQDAGHEDAASDAGLACDAARLMCGDEANGGRADTLYRCNPDGGTATLVARCANGCDASAPEEDDACRPPSPCVVGGSYCGGDKINGDPDVLYRCTSGSPVLLERCAKGCVVGAPGIDDACKR